MQWESFSISPREREVPLSETSFTGLPPINNVTPKCCARSTNVCFGMLQSARPANLSRTHTYLFTREANNYIRISIYLSIYLSTYCILFHRWVCLLVYSPTSVLRNSTTFHSTVAYNSYFLYITTVLSDTTQTLTSRVPDCNSFICSITADLG